MKNLIASLSALILLAVPASAEPTQKPIVAVPLSTQGSQIVDASNRPIRLLSVGMWYDENATHKLGGISKAGFNTIRLDWSNRAIGQLAKLDTVIAEADRHHLKVILDDHSNEAGGPGPWKPCYAQQRNGMWYDSGGASNNTDGCGDRGTVTDSKFVTDWQIVARRYKGNKTVIAYDLWNEPLGYGMSTWEEGDKNPTHNIRYMCERVGNAILAIDPDKLIICEGPMNAKWSFIDQNTPAPWGDLTLAKTYPVNLAVPNRLVYSVHDYPTDVGGYVPDSGAKKVAQMNLVWGYLVREHIAPVIIGEMGANMTDDDHRQWAQTLISYTNGRLGDAGGPTFSANEQGISTSWWFAGHQDGGTPSGIFGILGNIDPVQAATYTQFNSLN